MARARTATPTGHGELLVQPPRSEWADLVRRNAEAARSWRFDVCGTPVGELRARARREAVSRAREFSTRLGFPLREVPDEPELIVMTGHQPEFYHPGVWVKDFWLQQLGEETGAAAIDLVVDSDGFDSIEVRTPCLHPEVRVCHAHLAVGTSEGCYACTPVPPPSSIDLFCETVARDVATLPAPSIGHHFARFCDCLRSAAGDARDIAELITIARRRYEVSAGTDYLELPVTSMAGSEPFIRMLTHIALDAPRFAAEYNGALGEFRDRTNTRSTAQPFPDLRSEGDLIELPIWHLQGSRRAAVWARDGEEPALFADGELICDLRGCADAAEAVARSGLRPAPKALTLTLYSRLLVADFFIHGVGGGRYDQVTDDVIRRYFGVEPPAFAVGSMTEYLPLGAHAVTDDEVEAASMALNRLKHNPDQMLDEVEFDTAVEHARANALAADKARLVEQIAAPGADKKTLGRRIREVNAELASMLEPIERQMKTQVDQLRQLREASEVLTDRTYPFCFWSPEEISDKVR